MDRLDLLKWERRLSQATESENPHEEIVNVMNHFYLDHEIELAYDDRAKHFYKKIIQRLEAISLVLV